MRESKRTAMGERREGGARTVRRALGLVAAAGALAAAGCPGPHGGEPLVVDPLATAGPAAEGCDVPLPDEAPSFVAVAASARAASRWSVRVDLALARLRAQLDEGLPVDLAAGQAKSPGSPGRVSYSIRRKGLELRVEGGELLVEIPVVGQANVCVPMGPICPSVGSCSPAMLATARVPLDLGPDLGLQARRVDIKLTRGCVIAGVDASSRIVSGAGRYANQIQRRINELLPSVRPEAEAGWQRLQTPIPLPDGRCARAMLERVVHRSLEPPAGMLSFVVAAEGRVQLEPSCSSPPSRPVAPLPKASREPSLSSESTLAVVRLLDWATVTAGLDSSLQAADGLPSGLRSVRVLEARGVGEAAASGPSSLATGKGGGQLALRVALTGTRCGELWLLARPEVDAQQRSIRLRDVELVAGQPQRAALVAALGLEPWLAAHARIALGANRPVPPAGGAEPDSSSRAVLDHAQRNLADGCRVRAQQVPFAAGAPVFADGAPVVTANGLVVPELGRVELGVRIE